MSRLVPGDGAGRVRAGAQGLLALLLLLLLLLTFAAAGAAGPSATPLRLEPTVGRFDGWDAATVLFDPGDSLTLPQVLRRAGDFAPPPLRANLGRRGGSVWILLPLLSAGETAGRWLLDIDYPPLDRVELYLLDGGQVVQQALLGDHLDLAARAMPTRSHVVPLQLPAGAPRQLLLRVQSTGTLLVPLNLYTPEHYQAAEAREQALQGLLAGAALSLLLYSLAQWLTLRDAVFGLYALTLLGNTGFFAALAGMGPQHVWGGSTWLTRHGPPFWILVGVCGAFFFCLRALDVARTHRRIALALRACGALAGLAAAVYLAGGLSYPVAQAVGMALGPMPLLLVLPVAFQRLRAGDHAAAFLLAGWGSYALGVLVLLGLLGGWVPVGFWTMHGFQFASLVEMAMWLLVLGSRVQAMRHAADAVQVEREHLRRLVHTDVLTGLTNRRGLHEALPSRVARSSPRRLLAVYLLDLDGFKRVNDRFGHAVGDDLLVAVAQRLRAQVAAGDLACRLGGDEFVLAVGGLSDEAAAEDLGRALLASMLAPFKVAGANCHIGVTLGYALSPHDDASADGLLKRADAAMFAAKQSGRNTLRRGQASAGLSGLASQ